MAHPVLKTPNPAGAVEAAAPKRSRPRGMKAVLTHRLAKPVVFLTCLIPFGLLIYWWSTHQLGFNPTETLMRFSGNWTLRFLLITLCVTPLRKLPGWSDLIRFRRMIGLFAFFYGCVHLFNYLNFDKAWDWAIVWEDLTIRRFYIFGLGAFTLMLPLALTSTTAAIRWMGGKNWRRLHYLVYLAPAVGVVHFYLQDKLPDPESIKYGMMLATLLGIRVVLFGYKKSRSSL
jgi:methionine sulfoxide reductase heme-binding subunit